MYTRIDYAIMAYLNKMIDESKVTIEDIKELLDTARREYELDMVFLMENKAYLYSLEYTYCSVASGVSDQRGNNLYLTDKKYQELLALYDKQGLYDNHGKTVDDCDDSLLSYGLIIGDYYYGCVGFRSLKPHQWTEEERSALVKISKTIFTFIIEYRTLSHNSHNYFYQLEAKDSVGGYYIDLKSGLCHAFKIESGLEKFLPEWSNYNDMLSIYCGHMVATGYSEIVCKKFSAESIIELINTKNMEITMDYPRKSGCITVWMRLTAKAVDFDEKGKPYHITLVVNDVTDSISDDEKGKYAYQIIKSNYYLILSVNLESDTYAVIKVLDGIEGNISPDIGCYSTQVKKTAETMLHPDDRDKFENLWTLGNLRKVFDYSPKPISFEYRRIIGDGYRWVHADFIPNEDFGPGDMRITVYLRDASEEMERQQEQKNLVNALSSIYFLTFYIDIEEDKYLEINSVMEIDGFINFAGSADRRLVRFADRRVNAEHREMVRQFLELHTLRERLVNKKMISCEFIDNVYGWCQGNFIPVEWDGSGVLKKVIFVVSCIDEEKQKELETQMALKDAYDVATKANSAKTDFLSRMSHDIRTPMNAVIGMTSVAMANIDDKEKVLDCLGKISVSGNHLLSLINEVLDMSKIESGKLTLAEEPLNLMELIRNVVVMIKPEITAHKHNFKINYNNIIHYNVYGDSLRIKQIFMNIISNSIKYTPDGGNIYVTASEKKSTKKDMGCYVFVFQDDGIGMSQEFVDKIFEPFSREEDSRTSKIQGTGLGMSIVNNIVHLMSGNIKIDSKKGGGTQFTITCYFKIQNEGEILAEEDNIVNHNEKSQPEQIISGDEKQIDIITEQHMQTEMTAIKKIKEAADLAGKRVLVAEDQEFNQEIAQEFLEMLGVEVELAENGRQALDMVAASAQGYYDLIFMDIQMPVMNGYDSAKMIRKLDREDVKKLPIIAMTANAFAEDVQDALNAGMNEHIAKPININILKNALLNWIGDK